MSIKSDKYLPSKHDILLIKVIDGKKSTSWLLVSNVEELKELLLSLDITKVDLQKKLFPDKIQTEKESINVELLSKENFLWLIEKDSSGSRFIHC